MLNMLEKYDVYLVDAYGVFWDGSDFIPGAKKMLKTIVNHNKIVIILIRSHLYVEALVQFNNKHCYNCKHYHVYY